MIPGFGGSRLIDICPVVSPPKTNVPKNSFIDLNMFNKDWETKFVLKYDTDTGLSMDDDIDVYDFGGVDGIRNLCEDCTKLDVMFSQIIKKEVINNVYNYKYFDTLVNRLENSGYISRINLFGAPYDFRKIMIPEYLKDYFYRLKILIEDAYIENSRPSVLVSHSIGGLITYIFLIEYCDIEWKSKYIDSFVSVGAPYGGSSISLKTLISGLPKLSFLKDKYHNVLLNSSGMILALPNTYGYNPKDSILIDSKKSKKYNVNSIFEVLPSAQQNIWETYVKQYLPSYRKNTGVKTIIVSCLDNPTEFTYVYESLDKDKTLKEPLIVKTRKGDGVIPIRSLTLHEYSDLYLPNYSYYEIVNTDHTKILHREELYDIIVNLSNES
jgi:hypothetical protein